MTSTQGVAAGGRRLTRTSACAAQQIAGSAHRSLTVGAQHRQLFDRAGAEGGLAHGLDMGRAGTNRRPSPPRSSSAASRPIQRASASATARRPRPALPLRLPVNVDRSARNRTLRPVGPGKRTPAAIATRIYVSCDPRRPPHIGAEAVDPSWCLDTQPWCRKSRIKLGVAAAQSAVNLSVAGAMVSARLDLRRDEFGRARNVHQAVTGCR